MAGMRRATNNGADPVVIPGAERSEASGNRPGPRLDAIPDSARWHSRFRDDVARKRGFREDGVDTHPGARPWNGRAR